MKKLTGNFLMSAILVLFFVFGCNQNETVNTQLQNDITTKFENETLALLDFFNQTGDYINSNNIPSLVLAGEVNEFAKEYKLIDIRKPQEYKAGHIENAVNIQPKDIIDYLKFDVSAVSYDKIVIICNNGLDATFVTTVLRLLGYANVYAMKYGMSAWNKKIAQEYWIKNCSNKYAGKLSTEGKSKPEKANYPIINTGKKFVFEILEDRSKKVLDSLTYGISTDLIFSDLSSFFIINYWPRFQYKKAHIPGAYQYTPRESLKKDSALFSLPANDPIIIYDYSGHHSAAVAAYLQILSYNAYYLEYGANALMYNQLIPKQIGRKFANEDIHEYEIITTFNTSKEEEVLDSIKTTK